VFPWEAVSIFATGRSGPSSVHAVAPVAEVATTTMPKNFILDTNVLLHDPRSIYGFKDNNVIIPIYVIGRLTSSRGICPSWAATRAW
jgi:hypothetical protein